MGVQSQMDTLPHEFPSSVNHANALLLKLSAQLGDVATGRGVKDDSFVGQGGDEFVAAGGEFGRDASVLGVETGEKEQTILGERFFPVRWQAEVFQAAGG